MSLPLTCNIPINRAKFIASIRTILFSLLYHLAHDPLTHALNHTNLMSVTFDYFLTHFHFLHSLFLGYLIYSKLRCPFSGPASKHIVFSPQYRG